MERKLWQELRSRRFHAFKFRRQQPIGPYIADFVCFDAKLIVELDGGQHGLATNEAYDAARTAWLEQEGFRVLRFWNSDVIENFESVLGEIALGLGMKPW
ncbi:very-short-patch-repair endonuclease [Rhizomicrobium palustre]|uniref:Very-short-patch-repair endonuclease n=1 Tax=Rhizomicrobium palustre TaxID=189966 RepID=A0A846MYA0_9PROT|nr:very-short-patch-repair endonuclease [Rhizomicrobium palustre]